MPSFVRFSNDTLMVLYSRAAAVKPFLFCPDDKFMAFTSQDAAVKPSTYLALKSQYFAKKIGSEGSTGSFADCIVPSLDAGSRLAFSAGGWLLLKQLWWRRCMLIPKNMLRAFHALLGVSHARALAGWPAAYVSLGVLGHTTISSDVEHLKQY